MYAHTQVAEIQIAELEPLDAPDTKAYAVGAAVLILGAGAGAAIALT